LQIDGEIIEGIKTIKAHIIPGVIKVFC